MNLNQRLTETARLGFQSCVIPYRTGKEEPNAPAGLKLIRVRNVREAIMAVFDE